MAQDDDSHDWLGDAGEALVRYIAARDGLHVFGAGKWRPDAAIHDVERDRWWRVEVRTTDRDRRPTPKGSAKLLHTDILAEVRVTQDLGVAITFIKLVNGKRTDKRLSIKRVSRGSFLRWLREP